MSKVFIDTNLLVYAFDDQDPVKRDRARNLLASFSTDQPASLSTQVLQEFYVTCTRKLHMQPAITKAAINQLDRIECVLIDRPLILAAIDCSAMDQLSFWDALIVCAAAHAHCTAVWTEDLNHGQQIRGVTVTNPFLIP